MSTLGQELNREREMRGIPLQEIARQTKININYLIALEQDRLDLLPGEFFIKGTIRAYARCIGLEENRALNLYLRTGRPPSPPASKPVKPPSLRMSPGRWKKLAVMVLPLLVLAAVLLVFRPWSQPGRSTTGSASTQNPLDAVGPGAKAEPDPGPTAQQPGNEDNADLVLEMAFREQVWIRVQADGGPAQENLMQAGERKSVSAADRIVIRLGRPDQVDMTINGRKARPFPTSATAQTYEITKANRQSYYD